MIAKDISMKKSTKYNGVTPVIVKDIAAQLNTLRAFQGPLLVTWFNHYFSMDK